MITNSTATPDVEWKAWSEAYLSMHAEALEAQRDETLDEPIGLFEDHWVEDNPCPFQHVCEAIALKQIEPLVRTEARNTMFVTLFANGARHTLAIAFALGYELRSP